MNAFAHIFFHSLCEKFCPPVGWTGQARVLKNEAQESFPCKSIA